MEHGVRQQVVGVGLCVWPHLSDRPPALVHHAPVGGGEGAEAFFGVPPGPPLQSHLHPPQKSPPPSPVVVVPSSLQLLTHLVLISYAKVNNAPVEGGMQQCSEAEAVTWQQASSDQPAGSRGACDVMTSLCLTFTTQSTHPAWKCCLTARLRVCICVCGQQPCPSTLPIMCCCCCPPPKHAPPPTHTHRHRDTLVPAGLSKLLG